MRAALPASGRKFRSDACRQAYTRHVRRSRRAAPAATITRTVGWIPGALEHLDARLVAHLGPRWWDVIGWHPAGLNGGQPA